MPVIVAESLKQEQYPFYDIFLKPDVPIDNSVDGNQSIEIILCVNVNTSFEKEERRRRTSNINQTSRRAQPA